MALGALTTSRRLAEAHQLHLAVGLGHAGRESSEPRRREERQASPMIASGSRTQQISTRRTPTVGPAFTADGAPQRVPAIGL